MSALRVRLIREVSCIGKIYPQKIQFVLMHEIYRRLSNLEDSHWYAARIVTIRRIAGSFSMRSVEINYSDIDAFV
jgi:hypothetical protein